MAASNSTPLKAQRSTLGALTFELDILRDAAAALYDAYENDEDVTGLSERASDIGARGLRIATALNLIRDGIAEL